MTRAKKGKVHNIPKTLGEIKKTKLSNLTSAAQRKLLVSLNKESNLRLKDISNELNTQKLKPTLLQENNEYFRIQKLNKGYDIGPRKRFTLSKNLPKAQMEEQIKQRVKFLESVMTVTPDTEKRGQFLPENKELKNINDVYNLQQNELVKVFGKTMGENRALTEDQIERLGKLLNKARKHNVINDDDQIAYMYLKDYESIKSISESKEYVSIDNMLDKIEEEIEARIGRQGNSSTRTRKRQQRAAEGDKRL